MIDERSLTEPVLNTLLRRVDWRFLLPCPRPKYAACFAGCQLNEAVNLIAGRVTDSPEHAKGQCDLVVIDELAGAKIHHAFHALAEGGHLYGEWARPHLGGMKTLKDNLMGEGFTDVTFYSSWPAPGRGSPLFWLPIEHEGAVEYFFAHRPASHSRLEMLKRRTFQSVWRLALLTGMAFPLNVIARKPIKSYPTIEPKQMESRLLLTGGHSTLNKVVALVFDENASKPKTAMKWARVPQAKEALHREAVALQSVHALRPGGMPGVPRVVFSNFEEEQACAFALGETVLEGEPVYLRLNRNNFRRLSLQASEWLAKFAGSQTAPSLASTKEIAESALQEFIHLFRPVVSDLFASRLRAIFETLPELPCVCEHRDFSPWNVLIDNEDDIVVLDWESAVMIGMPALDLIYFLTYLAFFYDGAMESGRFRETYFKLLTDKTLIGSVFSESMSHYLIRMHIDHAALQPLRVLTWLIHARSEYSRLSDGKFDETSVKDLHRSVFISLLEEELTLHETECMHDSTDALVRKF